MEFDQHPTLSEGADRVARQLRGDKEYPFSGVTKSGRVWRRVPESDALSVSPQLNICLAWEHVQRNDGADTLEGKATLTSGLLLERSVLLRSLRHYLLEKKPRTSHHRSPGGERR